MDDLVPKSRLAPVVRAETGSRGRPIIVVVGMHRSGTSFCSHMLSVIGVNMASEIGDGAGNPGGHFERWEIMRLQDEVLAVFERGYFSSTHDFPLPPGWWMDLRLRPIKDRIKAVLAPFLESAEPFGFKDPRTARLIPLWNQVFAELGLDPRFVVCLRDPAHVGVSLHTRDKLDREAGEQRTLDYLVDALRYTRGRDRCFVRYDDWQHEPMLNAMRLLDLVDPDLEIDTQDLEIAVQSLFREDFSRSGQTPIKARQPLVRSFYDLVQRFAESNGTDAALEAKIDYFVQNYVAFRQLLRPFEAHVSSAIGARTAVEGQLAATQNELAAERATSAHLTQAHAEAVASHAEAVARATQAEAAGADQAARLSALTGSHEAREQEFSARLAEATGGASAAAAQAQQTAAAQAARIDELAVALAAADAERLRLSEAHAATNDGLASAQQAAVAHAARIEELAAALAAADAERLRLSEAHAATNDGLASAQQAAVAQAVRIEELAAALAAAEAERSRLSEVHGALEAEKLHAQQTLGAERLQAQQTLEAERLQAQQTLEAERLQAQRTLEAERLQAQQALEAERAAGRRRGLKIRLFGR